MSSGPFRCTGGWPNTLADDPTLSVDAERLESIDPSLLTENSHSSQLTHDPDTLPSSGMQESIEDGYSFLTSDASDEDWDAMSHGEPEHSIPQDSSNHDISQTNTDTVSTTNFEGNPLAPPQQGPGHWVPEAPPPDVSLALHPEVQQRLADSAIAAANGRAPETPQGNFVNQMVDWQAQPYAVPPVNHAGHLPIRENAPSLQVSTQHPITPQGNVQNTNGISPETQLSSPEEGRFARPNLSPEDVRLVAMRRAGYSYRQIARDPMFSGLAEPTLRGRHRAATRHPKERPRKPEWTTYDDELLLRIASQLFTWSSTEPRELLTISGERAPWMKVSHYIRDNGGSFQFGVGTCKKRYFKLCGVPWPETERERNTSEDST